MHELDSYVFFLSLWSPIEPLLPFEPRQELEDDGLDVGSPTEKVGFGAGTLLESGTLPDLSGVRVIRGRLLNACIYSFSLKKLKHFLNKTVYESQAYSKILKQSDIQFTTLFLQNWSFE